jgi:murein DD-endopeptidase MepM/ murein hydrolase activator NlpD
VNPRAAAAALALLAAGCPAPRPVVRPPTTPVVTRPSPIPLDAAAGHDEPAIAGVVHVVRRGETLYRIAKAYGIDLADLMETNGIADPRTVAVGTELFVPGAEREMEVPTPEAAEAGGASRSSTDGENRTAAQGKPRATSTASPAASPAGAAVASPARPTREEAAHAERSADASASDRGASSPASTQRTGAPPLAWPLKGVLYGRFGVRAGQRHDGIDIAAPEGTAVAAAADGTVLYVGEQSGYGAVAILRHEGGLVTLYAHNSAVLVHEGARVRRGEAIAKVGQTGRTTGPHLHFEVREGTRPRNPLLFLP